MTRDEIEALCDQLTYRPVGTTAAQMREAAAALREQQAELDENRKRFATMARVGLQHESEIVRLAAELAECRRDAERYRWLLEQPDGFEITIREPSEDPDFEEGEWVSGHTPAEIDAAIRAAMAGETA